MIALYKFAWTVFTWAGAWYLLKEMLSYLGSASTKSELYGQLVAMFLGLAGLLSSIAIHQQYAECNRVGVKIKVYLLYSNQSKRLPLWVWFIVNLFVSPVSRVVLVKSSTS
jgi:hypothetical protein